LSFPLAPAPSGAGLVGPDASGLKKRFWTSQNDRKFNITYFVYSKMENYKTLKIFK